MQLLRRLRKSTLFFFAAGVLLFAGTLAVAPPHLVSAQNPSKQVCDAIGNDSCDGGTSTITKTITRIINLLSAIGGIIATIMIIIGGVRYMTSGGDSNSAASARNTILYAVVGLIVVAFAQVIVRFALQTV